MQKDNDRISLKNSFGPTWDPKPFAPDSVVPFVVILRGNWDDMHGAKTSAGGIMQIHTRVTVSSPLQARLRSFFLTQTRLFSACSLLPFLFTPTVTFHNVILYHWLFPTCSQIFWPWKIFIFLSSPLPSPLLSSSLTNLCHHTLFIHQSALIVLTSS